MEHKVTSLFGDPIPEMEPHKGVIALLRQHLASAERGEIDGVAVAISRPSGAVDTSYDFGSASYRLVGAVVALEHAIARAMDRCVREIVLEGD